MGPAFRVTWEGLVADLVRELKRVRPVVMGAPHPKLDHYLDLQFLDQR